MEQKSVDPSLEICQMDEPLLGYWPVWSVAPQALGIGEASGLTEGILGCGFRCPHPIPHSEQLESRQYRLLALPAIPLAA